MKDVIKGILTNILRAKGKQMQRKDANRSGADDAGGRSMEAIADAVDTIDLSGATNPKSLRNIGAALIAAGEKLTEEAETIETEDAAAQK